MLSLCVEIPASSHQLVTEGGVAIFSGMGLGALGKYQTTWFGCEGDPSSSRYIHWMDDSSTF